MTELLDVPYPHDVPIARSSVGAAGPSVDVLVVDLTPTACGGRASTLFSSWLSRGRREDRIRTISFDPVADTDPTALLAALADVDAVVVTGTEPLTVDLADDPAARVVALLVDAVDDRELPACFSCLAAHAALAARHGASRRRLPAKLSGTYVHTVDAGHVLSAGLPTRVRAPHSRWYAVDRELLPGMGVTPLDAQGDHGWLAATEIDDPGCLYLQGHPEYTSATLFREYRRDFYRALRGESDHFPDLPVDSLEASLAARLVQVDRRARAGGMTLSEPFPAFVAPPGPVPWHGAATTLLENWLGQVRPGRSSR